MKIEISIKKVLNKYKIQLIGMALLLLLLIIMIKLLKKKGGKNGKKSK